MHGLDEYDSQARMYYPAIIRTTTIDPLAEKYYNISPYAWCGNNPVRIMDLNGMDWFENQDGTVKYLKDKISDFSHKKTTWTHLAADKYDKAVIDAIGADIMNTSNKNVDNGWNKFISYYENKDLGKDYFINAANKNYNDNASGFMKTIADNITGIKDAIRVSQMTHDWVDQGGWTSNKNTTEHYIGMFIIAEKFGQLKAENIGLANEVRGLFVNDRQNGTMWQALNGRGNTAFEWRDIYNNNEGIQRWMKYNGIIPPTNTTLEIIKSNTRDGVLWAPWNLGGMK